MLQLSPLHGLGPHKPYVFRFIALVKKPSVLFLFTFGEKEWRQRPERFIVLLVSLRDFLSAGHYLGRRISHVGIIAEQLIAAGPSVDLLIR